MQGSPEGLTTGQAEQIRSQVGENALKEGARKKAWQVFLEQFKDLLVIILIVAAVISMLSDNMESTIVIFAVIIMNAILGTVQHEKAQKSLEGLKAVSYTHLDVYKRQGKSICLRKFGSNEAY